MDTQVSSFLYIDHKISDYVISQHHSMCEMVFYKHGKGKTVIDGEEYSFCDNTFAVIGANVLHDELCEENTVLYFCIFETDQTFPPNGVYKINDDLIEKIFSTLEEIRLEIGNNFGFESEYIGILFSKILYLVNKNLNISGICSDDSIKLATNYIKENYSRNLNFQVLADSLGYSYDRLRHKFREIMGESMYQYLLKRRIAVAKQLLNQTKNPIGKIARMCGFQHATRFNTAFMKAVALTPTQFRRLKSDDGVVNLKEEQQ